jgi:hypothetical protein
VSGPRDHRAGRSDPNDKTVEVPLRSPTGAEPPPAEDPWWKNANTRVPPPPIPAQRLPPRAPQPPPPPRPAAAPYRHSAPARNRHAKTTSTRRKNGQVALLVAVGVIAISAAVIGILFGLSRFDAFKGKVLNVSKAEAGVQRILLDPADGYGVTSVTDVVCNNGDNPEIKKGSTFTCDVVVEGRKRQVLVVFADDNGTYEVDRPR